MAWPIYSERLIFTDLENVWRSWTVPAQMRAVIKSVQAANTTSNQHECLVYLQDKPFVEELVQARTSLATPSLYLVAYAGETIKALTDSAGMAVWVSGFLFGDVSGRAAAPGEVDENAPPPPNWPWSEDPDGPVTGLWDRRSRV